MMIEWGFELMTRSKCGRCAPTAGLPNIKLGPLKYKYRVQRNNSRSGDEGTLTSSRGTVYMKDRNWNDTGIPMFQVTDGWSTNSCCQGYTLYLKEGAPAGTKVDIYEYNNAHRPPPQSCCRGARITIQNDSTKSVLVTLREDQYSVYEQRRLEPGHSCSTTYRGGNLKFD